MAGRRPSVARKMAGREGVSSAGRRRCRIDNESEVRSAERSWRGIRNSRCSSARCRTALLGGALLEDLLGEVVADRGVVVEHLVVGGLKELGFAPAQFLTDGLLH